MDESGKWLNTLFFSILTSLHVRHVSYWCFYSNAGGEEIEYEQDDFRIEDESDDDLEDNSDDADAIDPKTLYKFNWRKEADGRRFNPVNLAFDDSDQRWEFIWT